MFSRHSETANCCWPWQTSRRLSADPRLDLDLLLFFARTKHALGIIKRHQVESHFDFLIFAHPMVGMRLCEEQARMNDWAI